MTEKKTSSVRYRNRKFDKDGKSIINAVELFNSRNIYLIFPVSVGQLWFGGP
jgi:hypothetical protein